LKGYGRGPKHTGTEAQVKQLLSTDPDNTAQSTFLTTKYAVDMTIVTLLQPRSRKDRNWLLIAPACAAVGIFQSNGPANKKDFKWFGAWINWQGTR
jgi:hypothetical protein